MRRPLSHLLVLCAWLLASGAQWDLAQLGAWGGMLARNAETLPWFEAVQKTLNGERCTACVAVAAARESSAGHDEETPSAAVASSKIGFAGAPATLVLASPSTRELGRVLSAPEPGSVARPAPTLRPPRSLA